MGGRRSHAAQLIFHRDNFYSLGGLEGLSGGLRRLEKE